MKNEELTALQRQALQCFEAARTAGVAFSEQARTQGLNLRSMYDALAQLRRRGVLPPGEPGGPRKKGLAAGVHFARVRRVEAEAGVPSEGLCLRVTLSNGRRVELPLRLEELSAVMRALERAG